MLTWFKQFIAEMKNAKEELNVEKKLPGYFNKNIFRIGFAAILLMFVVTLATNDFKTSFIYTECSLEKTNSYSEARCLNSYYVCSYENNTFPMIKCHDKPTSKAHKEMCDQGGCYKYINAGVSFGKKPNSLVDKLPNMFTTIILGCFILNHLLYWIKGGKKNASRNKISKNKS